MFFWDFRLVRTVVYGRSVLSVHRVFYDTPEKTKPQLIENAPACLLGATAKPMLQDIEMMLDSFHRPTIYIPEWNSGE